MRKAADKLSAVSKTTLMPLLGKHWTFITVRTVFRALKRPSLEMDFAIDDTWFVLGLNRGRSQFLIFFAAPMIL
jgi:hypothetical protein